MRRGRRDDGGALRRRPPSAVPPDAKHGFNSAGPSSPAPAASSPDALAALLALCGQGGDARAAPGMDELLELHLGKAAMAAVKVGEGTFGEAYRLGDSVVKVSKGGCVVLVGGVGGGVEDG